MWSLLTRTLRRTANDTAAAATMELPVPLEAEWVNVADDDDDDANTETPRFDDASAAAAATAASDIVNIDTCVDAFSAVVDKLLRRSDSFEKHALWDELQRMMLRDTPRPNAAALNRLYGAMGEARPLACDTEHSAPPMRLHVPEPSHTYGPLEIKCIPPWPPRCEPRYTPERFIHYNMAHNTLETKSFRVNVAADGGWYIGMCLPTRATPLAERPEVVVIDAVPPFEAPRPFDAD